MQNIHQYHIETDINKEKNDTCVLSMIWNEVQNFIPDFLYYSAFLLQVIPSLHLQMIQHANDLQHEPAVIFALQL